MNVRLLKSTVRTLTEGMQQEETREFWLLTARRELHRIAERTYYDTEEKAVRFLTVEDHSRDMCCVSDEELDLQLQFVFLAGGREEPSFFNFDRTRELNKHRLQAETIPYMRRIRDRLLDLGFPLIGTRDAYEKQGMWPIEEPELYRFKDEVPDDAIRARLDQEQLDQIAEQLNDFSRKLVGA